MLYCVHETNEFDGRRLDRKTRDKIRIRAVKIVEQGHNPQSTNSKRAYKMNEDEIIQEAIKLIDPKGLLQSGSHRYNSIISLLQRWLDQHGQAETFYMAKISAKFLKDLDDPLR